MAIVWKFGGLYKADAEEAYAEISHLLEITPENVLNLARNEASAIHDDFEWDNAVAGEKWRLEQAARMIRSFVIEEKDVEQPPVRVFQITSEPKHYKPMTFFVENKDEHKKLIQRAFRELEQFRNRYRQITELESVIEQSSLFRIWITSTAKKLY